MDCNNCKNCAWFCHADGMCWAPGAASPWEVSETQKNIGCMGWSFDGLEDWEREELDALVTMEAEA